MKKKVLFLSFIIIAASAFFWFAAKTGSAVWDYIQLSEKIPIQVKSWEVIEKGPNRYLLLANFAYEFQGERIQNQASLPREYPNPWAALKAQAQVSQLNWSAWISPKNPKVAQLEKKFPFKPAISALVMFGTIGYFLVLGLYVKGSGVERKTQETEEIWLRTLSEKGEHLTACFLPSKGMNLISYKKGDEEIIDQSTKNLFEERFAGLGAMIGPHFHHRDAEHIPEIIDESLFPHIAPLRAKGVKEPFSHGIGRYAPWKVIQATDTHVKATLKGSDTWKGIPLKDLEGQDFQMEYEATLIPQGLQIHLSVKSEKESVVGLHTYYLLKGGKGTVHAKVKTTYNDHSELKQIPADWKKAGRDELAFDLASEADFGFFPLEQKEGSIVLKTENRCLQVQYWCSNDDHSWQLWHPKDKSFVCIEPLSAADPRKPKQKSSGIKILITIL